MISRYQTAAMADLFAPEKRFEYMLKVETAVAKEQARIGMIPAGAFEDIRKKSKINAKRIFEIEKSTKHDVIAFVSQVAETIGKNGRFLHFGLTSSDVLDSALSLQINDAFNVLIADFKQLIKITSDLVTKHQSTICPGRTHGIFAEPTTFGYKLAGHLSEFYRVLDRLKLSQDQFSKLKLSGAVGTSSFLSAEFEEHVAKDLKLTPEPFATQVVPRDRHADVFTALAFLGSAMERLAIELRHLQRSEVSEVIEGFSPGQKGSSAMPHKKNPISAENITGLSRLLKGYMLTAFENVPLWHERDISHSSNERIMFPDAFTIAHYITQRMSKLLSEVYVDKERMKKNTQALGGVMFSSHLLLYLIEKTGWSREEAYKVVQSLSHALKDDETLKDKLFADKKLMKKLSEKEIDQIFSGKVHLDHTLKRLKYFKNYLRSTRN
jgi:adenylosuccinate lyase